MDINDIKSRMERLYLSVNQRFDTAIDKHAKIKHEVDRKHVKISISFGEQNTAEEINQVLVIISHIAKLKDHLKNLYESAGGNKQLLENEIESSDYLKLVIDLDNKEKHGDLKRSRSGKFPYLDDISRALTLRTGKQTQSTSSFTIDPITGEFKSEGNVAIAITANIKSSNGKIICSLDELIDKSIEKWEEIIKTYNLISK